MPAHLQSLQSFRIEKELSGGQKMIIMDPKGKYARFKGPILTDRRWPDKMVVEEPIWCSSDLRDGNQALSRPMSAETKIEFFLALVRLGFKQIEVGFPSANDTEFKLVRWLIEKGLIPPDVTIQVLTQAREELIKRTVESLVGVKSAIIHLYNSTSPAQREIVFRMDKSGIVNLAVQGTRWVKKYSQELLKGSDVTFQYSPESFSGTEPDFAVEICNAVIREWGPTPGRKMIVNIPETVQIASPNVYADQVENFCDHILYRDCLIISVHTHNDRGGGVVSAEFGLMAGADRVEGTLFGNGERTGNCDIVTTALNLYTQGVGISLDLRDVPAVRAMYEKFTGMGVHSRHPYAGDLVFTAFSGSHQDAIRKGLAWMKEALTRVTTGVVGWVVPYLHIDPTDIGRRDQLIRVNGQSGKGGIAHVLEEQFGIRLPKDMCREFGIIAGKLIDVAGDEVTAEQLRNMFWHEYIEREEPYRLSSFNTNTDANMVRCNALLQMSDTLHVSLKGTGNGPLSALVNALQSQSVVVHIIDQAEHALSVGESAQAIGYVQLRFSDGSIFWGAGVDTNTNLANGKAIISAINRHKACQIYRV